MFVKALSCAIFLVILFLLPVSAGATHIHSQAKTTSLSSRQMRACGIIERTVVRRGQHKGCEIEVRYPQFKKYSQAALRKLNHEIKHIVDINISMTAAPVGESDYLYSCDYKIQSLTRDLVSLKFNFTSDIGGAHPGSVAVPLNAQIYPTFKVLRLTDILKKNIDYKLLNRLLQKDLRAKSLLSTESLDDLPAKTFTNFTFVQSGLEFSLPEGVLDRRAPISIWNDFISTIKGTNK